MARTKTNTQSNTKTHRTPKTQQTFREKTTNSCVFFFIFLLFSFLFIISAMISARNVELPPWHGKWISVKYDLIKQCLSFLAFSKTK